MWLFTIIVASQKINDVIPMKETSQEAAKDILRLKKKALFFVWVGEIWNLLEAAVALWSGIRAGSVALLGLVSTAYWNLQLERS